MNVGQIKVKVANLLQKAVGDFVINGDDMLLMAINNARLFAEQTHDFEQLKELVQISISTPQGSDLSTAVLWGTNTPANVKLVVNCSLQGDDGSLLPIDFRKRDSVMAELRKSNRTDSTYLMGRYPADYSVDQLLCDGIREVMQFGRTILLRPMVSTGSVVIVMETYPWAPEYVGDADTDFFTLHGYNYLIWQSVVEANHLVKEFVFRQEGNLPSPEKIADKYLQALITNDLFSVDQNVDVTSD